MTHKWSSQKKRSILIWIKMIWNKNWGERRSSITSMREEEVIPSQPAASWKDFQALQSIEQMRYYAWEPRRQGGGSGQVLQLSLQPKQNELCHVSTMEHECVWRCDCYWWSWSQTEETHPLTRWPESVTTGSPKVWVTVVYSVGQPV